MMRTVRSCLAALLILSFTRVSARAAVEGSRVPIPFAEPQLVHFPDGETIPDDALGDMIRAELGTAYDPVQGSRYPAALPLIDKFFHARTAASRKAAIDALTKANFDPGTIGQLCRVRQNWPALAGGGIFYVNQRTGPYPTRYFVGVPKSYDRAKAWPLCVVLPDPNLLARETSLTAERVIELYRSWIDAELTLDPNTIVLMPLVNLDELYGPSYAGMNSVIQPLLDVGNHVSFDPARVYLVGRTGLTASAAWNLALHYSTYFSAFNALAGPVSEDWQRARFMNLRNTLPVFWHDDADSVLKVNFSKTVANELHSLKVEADFIETQKMGHQPTAELVQSSYQKMTGHVRDLYPHQVWVQTDRPDVIFNRVDWVQIYQQLSTGKPMKMFFPRTSGSMTVYPLNCSVRATIHDNQIEASVDNVNFMQFRVNDRMVDLSRPVKVTVNGKEKFNGVLKPDMAQMLNDQLFMGRGWRYYQASIDIEMTTPTPATQPTTMPTTRGRIIVGG